jgi:predicted ATP-grasp superfamily ATP-dependent carboligase
MDALVTDAHLPNAVAGMRGLGRAGHRLVALGDHWSAGGLWSRYATRRAVGPTAATDPTGFTATIARLAVAHGPLVIYPSWDGSIPAVLNSSRCPGVVLPYPNTAPEVVERLRDKRELPGLARVGGLTAPTTLAEGKAKDIATTSIPFPCVLKPIRSGGNPSTARPAGSPAALRNLLADIEPTTELLVQEFVPGKLMMLALVLNRDRSLVACFQQVARRVWPRDAGGASVAVSVPLDTTLVRAATKLLATVGFSGMAQFDFIETDRGMLLIDINPRYYTSMPLALACGVNLPAIWHAVVVGQPTATSDYRAGVAFRWLEADIRAATYGAPRILADRPRGRVAGAMWAWDDPAPGPLLFMRASRGRLARMLRLRTASRP